MVPRWPGLAFSSVVQSETDITAKGLMVHCEENLPKKRGSEENKTCGVRNKC